MKKGSSIKRALGMRQDMSYSYYMLDFVFRRLLRHNTGVKWAVHHTTTIRNPKGIVKGIGVWPGDSPGMYINANNGIHIGDFSNLGPNCGLISSNHDLVDNDLIIPGPPIRIGKFCWLGMGVIVLPGVQLGDFTVVGAGAVVTKSFEQGYCVLGGNPARVIRELQKEECDERARLRYNAQAALA